MKKNNDFTFLGLPKSLMIVILSLLLFSCKEPTLEERAAEELVPTVNKLLSYIKEVKVVEPKVELSKENFVGISFYLSGKDINGNIIGGLWHFGIKKTESEDSSVKYIMGLDPVCYSRADSSRYSTNYPIFLDVNEKQPESEAIDAGYIRKRETNGVTWYELIKDKKHGIVGENGAIIEPPYYDSIVHKRGDFVMYYTFKTEDNKDRKGMAILDKEFYPIVPIQYFAKNAFHHNFDEVGALFYYDVIIDSCLSIDNKNYRGIIDSYGTWVFHPVFNQINYNNKNNRYRPNNIPPVDYFDGTPDEYNYKSKFPLRFSNMPLGAYIDRATNRAKKVEEDLTVSYYHIVKKYTQSWPSGEWIYNYLDEYKPPYLNVMEYKDKLYVSNLPYECPMVLVSKDNTWASYRQEAPTLYTSNTIVEIDTEGDELNIRKGGGEIEFYRKVDEAEINQQGKILDERKDYYLRRAAFLNEKNNFGDRRMSRAEVE